MGNKHGVIYIFTNPSFPEYVKIGYADDVRQRLNTLNSSSATPFAFRICATYDVQERLEDMKLHTIIDTLNPELRSVDVVDGKKRVREFFSMSKEDAYSLFEAIAEISGTKDRLHKWELTSKEIEEEQTAEENREINLNRHHFKDIRFSSSLTGKEYYTKTNDLGTLSVYECDSNNEIENNSTPSKKAIVGKALEDLGETVDKNDTLYQRVHRLTKIILKIQNHKESDDKNKDMYRQ